MNSVMPIPWKPGTATELVGGVYGIAIGRVFFGESMFSTETDASKVALAALMQQLAGRGFGLLDCQLETRAPELARQPADGAQGLRPRGAAS